MINIMISINEPFVRRAQVMLKSIAVNTSQELSVYLLYNSLSEETLKGLSDFCEKELNATLHTVYVDSKLFEGLPLTARHFSIEIYFRLIAIYALPDSIDRILYLDADIIVNNDISNFYNANLNGASVGVVKDLGNDLPKVVSREKLGLSPDAIYFNSGVILFDLKSVRKKWSKESMFELINKLSDVLYLGDQDILNVMFEHDKRLFDNRYNYQIMFLFYVDLKKAKEADIVHFIGPCKPWETRYINKGKKLYWHYHRQCFGNKEYLNFLFENKLRVLLFKLRSSRVIDKLVMALSRVMHKNKA